MNTMRKILYSILVAALILVPAMTVLADETDNTVIFDGKTLFNAENGRKTISGLLPGGEATYKVNFRNDSNANTDWYVENKVIKSFEDNSQASGGAYTYILKYINSDGAASILFSNENIGGDLKGQGSVGLHQASSAMEDYFYLDTVAPGKGGSIELYVALDGESQANAYMNSIAEINIQFAVEAQEYAEAARQTEQAKTQETKAKSGTPKTGDSLKAGVYAVILAGAIAAFAVITGRRKRDDAEK